MGPLSAETEIVFAHPNVRAALFDETAGTMTVVAPESSLVPADLIGVPLVIATAPGSFISFEGIDLRGVARVDMIATALSAFMEGGRIEIRQGDVDGTLIDSVKVESRLLPSEQKFSASLVEFNDVEDLFFVFQPLDPSKEHSGALLALLSVNFVTDEDSAKGEN